MHLVPVTTTEAVPPRFDAEARALYVYVGASHDRRVARTLSADGINFDCNGEGIVIGIEVLINLPNRIVHAEIQLPEVIDARFHNLVLDADPDVTGQQAYDDSRCTMQIGTSTHSPAVRISQYLLIALDESGRVTLWITEANIMQQ